MLTAAVLGLLRLDTYQVGSIVDDAHYVVLAESLASGQGYRLINELTPTEESTFPPGWPLLLAPFVALTPGHYGILQLFALLCWLTAIPVIHRYFSARSGPRETVAVMAFVALNPDMVGLSGAVMSEPAYILASFLCLTLVDRLEASEADRARGASWCSAGFSPSSRCRFARSGCH